MLSRKSGGGRAIGQSNTAARTGRCGMSLTGVTVIPTMPTARVDLHDIPAGILVTDTALSQGAEVGPPPVGNFDLAGLAGTRQTALPCAKKGEQPDGDKQRQDKDRPDRAGH